MPAIFADPTMPSETPWRFFDRDLIFTPCQLDEVGASVQGFAYGCHKGRLAGFVCVFDLLDHG